MLRIWFLILGIILPVGGMARVKSVKAIKPPPKPVYPRRTSIIPTKVPKDPVPSEYPEYEFPFIRERRIYAFPVIREALLHYRSLYGDLLVPSRFVVPEHERGWPSEARNMALGIVVQTIRRGSHKTKRVELLEMGFCFDVYELRYQFGKAALLLYKQKFGDLLVPQYYEVPENDIWPAQMYGLKLGRIVHNVREGKLYKIHRDELLEMGFDYQSQKKFSWESFKIALWRYKELHGDMFVPRYFILPTKTSDWPREAWGMKLGETINEVLHEKLFHDKRDELIEIGFCYSLHELKYQMHKICLLMYKEIHGNLFVEKDFIVPQTDIWPRECWDVELGLLVENIRKGKYQKKKEELKDIGFEYYVRKKGVKRKLISTEL